MTAKKQKFVGRDPSRPVGHGNPPREKGFDTPEGQKNTYQKKSAETRTRLNDALDDLADLLEMSVAETRDMTTDDSQRNVKVMVANIFAGKSNQVKAQILSDLLDRKYGKAIQKIETRDITAPKPLLDLKGKDDIRENDGAENDSKVD